MTLLSFSPPWFYGYDVVLEIGFALTALIIAFFAFKIFHITDQRPVWLFGISFLLIAISYVIQSLLNLLIVTQTDTFVCNALKLPYISLFGTYGIFVHMLFMTAGLVLLTYMSFKIEKPRVLWVLLSVALIAIFSSVSPLHVFFLLSTTFLAIILWHFISNYRQTRQMATLLVVLAFAFLLFGSVHFLISVDHELYYAIGHVLELFAYMLILANLYVVLSHGKKT